MTSAKHDWNRLREHIRIMIDDVNNYDYFIEYHNLDRLLNDVEGEFTAQNTLRLDGQIVCAGGIVIDVLKLLVLKEEHGVLYSRTDHYGYNVRIRRPDGDCFLFRYDCGDAHTYKDFATAHHKHESNFYQGTGETCGENDRVFEVGEEWPHVGEVVEEAATWYHEHMATL